MLTYALSLIIVTSSLYYIKYSDNVNYYAVLVHLKEQMTVYSSDDLSYNYR